MSRWNLRRYRRLVRGVEGLESRRMLSFAPLQVGDANQNGSFDQADVIQVLHAGKYLTGEPATFAEGDWNGDGVFSPLDIVAALATGTHV